MLGRACLLAVLVLASGPAAAGGQDVVAADAGALRPEALVAAGRRAEDALDLGVALDRYEEATLLGAGTRAGRHAEARATYLRDRRGRDGEFDDLTRLEAMRRGEVTAERLAAFAVETRSMAPGRVRSDAFFLLGEGYLHRLGRPAEAVPFYEALLVDPSTTSERRRTATVALAEAGASGDALAALEGAGLGASFEAEQLRGARARRGARAIAVAAFVVGFALVVLFGRPFEGLRPAARALGRRQVAAALYVVLVPATIAAIYDPRVVGGFALQGLGALPLLFLASAAGHSLRRRGAGPRARGTVLVAVVLATGAMAWLALDVVDGLGGFGFP